MLYHLLFFIYVFSLFRFIKFFYYRFILLIALFGGLGGGGYKKRFAGGGTLKENLVV